MFQLTPAAFLFYLSASRLEPLRVRDRVKSADWAESAGFTRDTAFYFIYLLLLRGNHLKSLLTFNRAAAAQRGPNVLGFEINFPTGNSYQRVRVRVTVIAGNLRRMRGAMRDFNARRTQCVFYEVSRNLVFSGLSLRGCRASFSSRGRFADEFPHTCAGKTRWQVNLRAKAVY